MINIWFVDPIILTAQSALLSFDLWWLLKMTFWYSESYVPLGLTVKYLEDMEAIQEDIQYGLANTLTNPLLLQQFEEQLLSEWAIENILFFKSVVIYQLNAEKEIMNLQFSKPQNKSNGSSLEQRAHRVSKKLLQKAMDIYDQYLRNDAIQKVNLPADLLEPINVFFTCHEIEEILDHSDLSTRSFQTPAYVRNHFFFSFQSKLR